MQTTFATPELTTANLNHSSAIFIMTLATEGVGHITRCPFVCLSVCCGPVEPDPCTDQSAASYH